MWAALTTPELIKQWFFGVETQTDWKPGSPIVHRGEYRGRPYEDRGAILVIEPDRLLVHTHWSPVSGTPDTPDNYQHVSWSLMDLNGKTELVVGETNLPSEEAKAESEKGWKAALDGLKRLVEAAVADGGVDRSPSQSANS